MEIWDRLFTLGIPDSWAYRWLLVCQVNNGLTALPNKNLVKNIGFGDDATHTKNSDIVSIASEGIGSNLLHPLLVARDYEADMYSFDYHFYGIQFRRSRDLKWKLWNAVKSCLSRPSIVLKKVCGFLLSR